MATNPATSDDLEARWRTLSPDEATVANALLDDAWARLITYAPSVPGDLDAGTVTEDLVISILCAAVLRVMKNPDGNRAESIDDYSWTRDSAVSAGYLYFSDIELELVRGVEPKAASIRFSNTTIQCG